jgi:hypothetical protein
VQHHQIHGVVSNGLDRFKAEVSTLNMPGLQYAEDIIGRPYVCGTISLKDEENDIIDQYQVKITPTENYPYCFPLVFETAGRIPINVDWHVFPDGHCCIKSFPEEILICKNGIDFSWFIEKQVIPYFFNQKHREAFGYFLRERSHGMQGHIEFFQDLLKTKNLSVIAKTLYFVKKRMEPSRTAYCFCGNRQKFRKCCRAVYRTLASFTDEELETYLRMVITSPNFQYGI